MDITEYAYDALVPNATSTSMLATPRFNAFQAPLWNLQPITNCTGVVSAHFRISSHGKPAALAFKIT